MSDQDTMTLDEIEMSKLTKIKNRMELDEIIGGIKKCQELLV